MRPHLAVLAALVVLLGGLAPALANGTPAPASSTGDAEVETSDGSATTDLVEAVRAHPFHSPADLQAISGLGLGPAASLALTDVIQAHARLADLQATQDVPADQRAQAQAALADAIDAAIPALQAAQVETTAVDRADLGGALADLYTALGLGSAQVDALAPFIEQATSALPAAYHPALADLIAAQADLQAATRDSLLGPPSSSDEARASSLSSTLAGLALAQVGLARAASQAPLDEPWTDPLGLIVVGTPGPDTFDSSLAGDASIRGPVDDAVDQARGTVGQRSADAGGQPAGTPVGERTHANASAGTSPGGLPAPGWHMLVVDPGGDDVYRDNAGGISTGGVAVQVDLSAGGPIATIQQATTDDDGNLCLPATGICEPTGAGVFVEALGAAAASGHAAGSLGLPASAIAIDLGGDDTYEPTGAAIQGAATGAGLGVLVDADGDDTYTADELAQGASEAGGTGVLVDLRGDDTYTAEARAQGWSKLPSATVAPDQVGFLDGQAFTTHASQAATALLYDGNGTDTYQLGDLLTGQGTTELAESYLGTQHPVWPTPQPDRQAGRLIDVGSFEALPAPVIEADGQPREVEPITAYRAGEPVAQAWVEAPLQADSASPGTHRYKTAADLATSTDPRAGQPALLRNGSVVVDGATIRGLPQHVCIAAGGAFTLSTCGALDEVEIPRLLQIGSPNHVDTPALITISLQGDTTYTGPHLRSQGLPMVLIDVAGDDTYLGPDRSMGYAEAGGTTILVDVAGDDLIEAGDRSAGHATDPGSLALVRDLDGVLTVRSGERSQAYAEELTLQAKGVPGLPGSRIGDVDMGDPSAYLPPVAVLDLGQGEPGTSGSDLAAGHESQGYSVGTGVALLLGSPGDDTYAVDGWGLGVHTGQQLVDRFCEQRVLGEEGGLLSIVDAMAQSLTPWVGGLGAVVDPSGDDTYTLSTQVGLGDATADFTPCPGHLASHVSLLGLGTLLDAEGEDTYALPELGERPESFEDRACSGPRDAPCEPGDDRAWSVVREAATVNALLTTGRAVGALGIGVDDLRNLHHVATSTCREYQPRGRSALDGLRPQLWQLGWDRIDASPAGEITRTIPEDTKQDVPQCGGWLAILGALAAYPVADQRAVEIQVADPVTGEPAVQSPGDSQLALDPECRDERSPERLHHTPEAGTCLTVRSDLAAGTWPTRHPEEDPTDLGDTVACNCSAELTIRPAQGARLDLAEVADADPDLYPSTGEITTYTQGHAAWLQEDRRLAFPVQTSAEGAPVDRAPSAAFPMDLATFPQGLAVADVDVRVEDAASEESGGAIPPATAALELPVIHQRPFDDAFLQEGIDGWGLFLVSDGAVEDGPIHLELATDADPALVDELEQAGWELLPGGLAFHDLPAGPVIDGPQASAMAAVLHGPAVCAGLTLAQGGAGGPCWTGQALVIGLPVGTLDPGQLADTVDAVHAPGFHASSTQLEAEARALTGAEASSTVVDQTQPSYDLLHSERYREDHPDEPAVAFEDVHGLPGTEVLEPGDAWADQLLGDDARGMWAEVALQAPPGSLGLVPGNLTDDGEANVSVWLHPDQQGAPVALHRNLTVRQTVEGFETVLSEPQRIDLSCPVASLIDPSTIQARLPQDGQITGQGPTCLIATDGTGQLSVLLPLGTWTGPRLIELDTVSVAETGQLLATEHRLHLDPVPSISWVALDPQQGQDAETNATLTVFPSTFEEPRLRSDVASDLTAASLEARVEDGRWTQVRVFDGLPTPEDPSVTAALDLDHLVTDDSQDTILEVRGVVTDESGNTHRSDPASFLVHASTDQTTSTQGGSA